jgi:ribulose-phosphate 3-epimerase
MKIIPAILPHTFEDLKTNLQRIKGVSNTVQIDLCDGIVGADVTWLPNGRDSLPTEFSYEFDIMLKNWKIPVAQCLLLKATSIVAHVDTFSEEDIRLLIEMVRPYGVALGISVTNDNDIHVHSEKINFVKKYYDNVFIQVMGIRHVGQQGQPFDDTVLARTALLKQEFPNVRIQVDGAVKIDTINLLKDVGVDSVVAGSSIFGAPDAGIAYENLKRVVS